MRLLSQMVSVRVYWTTLYASPFISSYQTSIKVTLLAFKELASKFRKTVTVKILGGSKLNDLIGI